MIIYVQSQHYKQTHIFHMWDTNNTLVNPDLYLLTASATFTKSNTGVNWQNPKQFLCQRMSHRFPFGKDLLCSSLCQCRIFNLYHSPISSYFALSADVDEIAIFQGSSINLTIPCLHLFWISGPTQLQQNIKLVK